MHLTPTAHLNKPKKVVKNDLLELLPKMLPSFFFITKGNTKQLLEVTLIL